MIFTLQGDDLRKTKAETDERSAGLVGLAAMVVGSDLNCVRKMRSDEQKRMAAPHCVAAIRLREAGGF